MADDYKASLKGTLLFGVGKGKREKALSVKNNIHPKIQVFGTTKVTDKGSSPILGTFLLIQD